MSKGGIKKYWNDKYREQLSSMGVAFPEDATNEQLKDLLKGASEKREPVELPPTQVDDKGMMNILLQKIADLEADRRQHDIKIQSLIDQGRIRHGMVPLDQMEKDATLPEEKVFFCNAKTHVLSEKIINGISTPPPFSSADKLNLLVFREAYSIPILGPNGHVEEERRVSILKTTSTRLYNWIRGNEATGEKPHHEFGVRFWESARDAVANSHKDTARLLGLISSLRSYSKIELNQMATRYGIPVSHDQRNDELVFPLANAISQEEKKRDVVNMASQTDRLEKELLLASARQ